MPISESQRGSLHLWFECLAQVLNDAGHDVEWVLSKKTLPIPWSKMLVKELLYKDLLKKMTDKDSTEDMSKIEPSELCHILNKALIERNIIEEFIPWPSEDNRELS